ncbi:hypothetical protein F7725_004045 [Dissostichus mawsoni]|uniref:Uncharacterized protein n=1 Tax=Dissostichus mawsoni TaxID=36200 RepID=A0A7J5YEJ2_DISMA|nr:hypothetical protein F7725_004045 [Dissostichus mawsoni]
MQQGQEETQSTKQTHPGLTDSQTLGLATLLLLLLGVTGDARRFVCGLGMSGGDSGATLTLFFPYSRRSYCSSCSQKPALSRMHGR